MAQRILSKTLKTLSSPSISSQYLPHRSYSSHHKSGQIIEIDLDSSSSSSSQVVEVIELKNLNELVHDVMVYRFAPDWLPFLPGSSFWVPPVPPHLSSNLLRLSSLSPTLDFGSGSVSELPIPEEVEAVHVESSTEKPSSDDNE